MPESFSSRPDAGQLPELGTEGLVLWRLRSDRGHRWCEVADIAGALAVRVHDPTTRETLRWEAYETAASVVRAASEWCEDYLAAGWVVIDIDLDEPD